jgi:hypothetical protein
MRSLTVEEMERVAGGRGLLSPYDSTEYSWEEMSTGDVEWATGGLIATAQQDVREIVETSNSIEEARQRIDAYLASRGLTSANIVETPEDGTIVVTAPPPPSIAPFDPFAAFADGTSGAAGGSAPLSTHPVADSNPDGPDVDVEVVDEANRAKVESAAERLKAEIEELDAKFASLSDTAAVQMKNGSIITGAQAKAWWQELDFRVTDRTFPPKMGGAVADGISHIRFDTVTGWDAWDPNGLTFIILHEVVHNSTYGEIARDASFFMHNLFGGTKDDYDPTDYWWDFNEEHANWGARELMKALSVPAIVGKPEHGYADGVPPPPPPPPPPPGGGGPYVPEY